MEARNMVDPATGKDMGGNPLMEGIFADAEGWQNRNKRDESFASVQKTADDWGSGGGGFDFGEFNFSDEPDITSTHKVIVDRSGQVYSMPEPCHHEDIANANPHLLKTFPNGLSLGAINSDGSSEWFQHDNGQQPQQLAETLTKHMGQQIVVDERLRPASNEDRWDVNQFLGPSKRELDVLHGPARRRISPGTPYPFVDQRQQEGLVRGGGTDHREVIASLFGNIRDTMPSDTLDQTIHMPWTHTAEQGASAQAVPGQAGIHFGTVKLLSFLDATVNGLSARQAGKEIVGTYSPFNAQGWEQIKAEPVTVTVPHPEYLPAAVEFIQTSADPSRVGNEIKALAQQMHQGTVPFPPGISAEQVKIGAKQAVAPLAVAGLGAAARFLAPKILGAAVGQGALSGIGGLLGMGGGGEQQQAAPPLDPRDISRLTHQAGPYEHPSTVPEIGTSGDPEKVDTHEFNDGATINNPEDPTVSEGGADTPSFDDHGLQEFDRLAPKIVDYAEQPRSGLEDPEIKALHEYAIENVPGYAELPEPSQEEIEQLLAQHSSKVANPSLPPGQAPMGGPTPPVAPVGPQVAQQGLCPQCGGTTVANGSCPQCGYGQQTPTPTAVPGAGATATPGVMTGFSNTKEADHAGPRNTEQLKAVAQFLIDQGRVEEVPHLLEAPWEYAQEMAQVQNKVNEPPIDPTEAPPEPAQEEAPPGATMPFPDPSQQIAAAVERYSADSIAPRCPKCESATTGVLNGKGELRCHACGNVWNDDRLVKEERTALRHDHEELHAPAIKGLPAADQEQQRDVEREQDSSHTWKTDDGEPLQVGLEYEMHSSAYDIPDVIRIEAVKPDAIEFTIAGEYGLEHKTEITHEEAQIEDLHFIPSAGPEEEEQQPEEKDAEYPDTDPTQTTDLSTPHIRQTRTADAYDVADGYETAPAAPINPDPHRYCQNCGEPAMSQGGNYNPSTIDRQGIQAGGCPVCNTVVEPPGDFYEAEGPYPGDWAPGQDPSARPPRTEADTRLTSVAEEPAPDPELAWLMEGNSGPIETIDDHRTAGAAYDHRQQREFIDEEGTARNSDRLNLSGTHYETRDASGDASRVRDDDLFLGLL
jgi:hypothetical protein